MTWLARLEIPAGRWTGDARGNRHRQRDRKQAMFDQLVAERDDVVLIVRFKPAGDLVVELLHEAPSGRLTDYSAEAMAVVTRWL